MRRINKAAVIVAALPHILIGYPWYAYFRDPWFEGGGLTVEQLINGPGYATAFSVAILSSVIMSAVLAFLLSKSEQQTVFTGMKLAALLWLAFIAGVLGTQYTFEARTLAYFGITAGHPLVGLLIMGAILGGWKAKPKE